jgi:hypothetical protein
MLPGCTGLRLVDNQVISFAPQKITPGASYRFERLPSQQTQPDSQNQLEELATQALTKVGLARSEAAALTVQVNVQQLQVVNPESAPFGWGFGRGGLHVGHHRPWFHDLGTAPLYWREVSLVMRDAQGKVVFESHATHEGIWSDSQNILAAMLDAALKDFPTPPSGARRVDIEIPR